MADRFASIDIGTNTILMLIAEADDYGGFQTLTDEHNLARLGEGIGTGSSKLILPEAIERSKIILKKYRNLCDSYNVTRIYAAGTSALRDSENSFEVKKIFESIINSDINIISGEQEAFFSFTGAVNDNSPSIVIDIGGGSTEIIRGLCNEDHRKGINITDRISLQIGAVRLTERYFSKQPATNDDLVAASEAINNELEKIEYKANDYKVYAVAGTPTTLAGVAMGLADFDRDKIQGYYLTKMDVESLYHKFSQISPDKINIIYGVHNKRADVITAGSLILLEILNKLKSEGCKASTMGLRYGIMKGLINNSI